MRYGRSLMVVNQVRLGMLLMAVLLSTACSDMKLPLVSGEPLSWQAQRGQWVFINYWAEWCKPCRKEIPELNAFAAQRRGQVVVLGVNFDNPEPDELQRQIRAMDIAFPQLSQDPAATLGFERPAVLPATYIFDPEGAYRGVMVGPQTEATLSAWLKASASLAIQAE